jgi:uncharacterized protein with von Willebrand factor type A (vWA) domain
VPPVQVVRPVAVPGTERPAGEGIDPEELPAATASEVEVLRHRDLARLSPAERDVVRRLIALLDPVGETRVSRRHRPAYRGTVDPGRTVRTMLRRGGEPVRLERRARRVRPRRLVLLVDVSGSMQPYADPYLRFAHAAARRRPGTEVFTIGTRLTRITREMRSRDPSTALLAVSAAVPDWSGGTRLGDQMARLARLAHRVVWVNPHRGMPGYVPMTAGMQAALPSVDDFVDGHTFDALERLATLLAAGRGGNRRA